MGAALHIGSRHDTATPAAPPTPRPEAPRGADARPGAGALVRAVAGALAAAALYSLACPPHEWSLLAWLVPGLLLVAVRRLGIVRALACGALFGVAIGYGITGWAFHAALEYFAFNRPLTAGFVLAVWLFYSGVPNALLCAAYVGLAERVPGLARGPLGAWLLVVMELLGSTQLHPRATRAAGWRSCRETSRTRSAGSRRSSSACSRPTPGSPARRAASGRT